MTSNSYHGFNYLLGFSIFFVLLNCASSGGYLEDSCTIKKTNVNGRCKYLADCPKALEELHSKGIRPENCGYDGVNPIVCCAENIYTPQPLPLNFPGGKIQQKCKEYREYYKKNIAKVPLPNLYVPINEECDFIDSSHLQGNTAKPNEFPHMAAIGYESERPGKKSWLCTGALISDQYVLTAAHCLTARPHGEPKYIRIGDLDLNSKQEDMQPPQEFKVTGIYMHPEFQPPSFYNDIGLLKMDRAAKIFPSSRPACLNTNPNIPDKRLIVAGWGKESHYSDKSSPLLKETLHYFSHQQCRNFYQNVTSGKQLKHGIMDETQLCVVPHGDHYMCEIGTGVLQIYNEEEYCMYTIVGITSFGRTSNDVYVPEVFTKVSSYTQWIEGIIWPS